MSSSVRDPGTSDYEYRQRVRKYRPGLPAAAARRGRRPVLRAGEWLNSPFREYTPWALADAPASYGTEHNRADASDQDLLQALNAYSRFEDPVVRDDDGRACLLRMAGQQMTWQASERSVRTVGFFTDGHGHPAAGAFGLDVRR